MRKIILFCLLAGFLSCTDKMDTDTISRMENKLYPFEGYYEAKQYPNKEFPVKRYFEELKNVKSDVAFKSTSGTWDVQGPGNIGARVNTLAIHPTDANIIYAGFSHGGVFKTIDGGINWIPIFDEQSYLSISEITIDENNPNLIYVGTGDHNISGYPFVGDGVYKSDDAGETWTNIGLGETSIISRINIAPSDNDILYTATMGLPFEKNNNRGLYKSIDKGASWEQVLFVNDSTGVIDLLVHPEDPDIVYAATWNRIRNNKKSLIQGPDAKIYKTINGGTSWEVLEGGLPQENFSRIGLAMSAQNPDKIFAVYIGTDFQVHGVYVTGTAGESWFEQQIAPFEDLTAGFGWYFGQIRVNPADDNDIFLLGVDMIRSRDNGFTWEEASPPWWTYEVHADKHELIMKDGVIYLGTDGGVYKSSDDTETWEDIENIPATQFYRVAYNPHRPDLYYGGAQDNGSTGGSINDINQWERIYGGDGYQMIFNPDDELHYYVETQNGGINYTTDGGISYNNANNGVFGGSFWDTPYIMSSHNSNVMYYGGSRLFKTEDSYNPEWFPISEILADTLSDEREKKIICVAESALNPDLLLAGTSDGRVWKTNDQGGTWANISAGVRTSYVSDVNTSTYDENVMYATVTAYKDNENAPFIYRSEDGGATWESIHSDLPQLSINEMYIYPESLDKVIFVATDGGVYVTIDAGLSWERLGEDMPVIPVYDLVYNPVKDELVAGTFARGIQSFDLSQIDLEVSSVYEKVIEEFNFTITQSADLVDIRLSNIVDMPLEIRLMNNAGMVLHSGMISAGRSSYSLSTAEMPVGMYYVQLRNQISRKTEKLIINY